MPMTNEEFKRWVREIYEDAKDPTSEYSKIKDEYNEVYENIIQHDPKMAAILKHIFVGFVQLGDYVKARIET